MQKLVEGRGFEPLKAVPADLQSAPFDRSGTPPTRLLPNTRQAILRKPGLDVNLKQRRLGLGYHSFKRQEGV